MSKYYDGSRILATHSTYNILLGQRANGKSYFVKKECVKEAFLGMGELIYLRRFANLELKEDDVRDYFRDCPTKEITGGEYNFIDVYHSRIYLSNIDESGEVTRGKCIGRTAGLSKAGKLKSAIQRGQYKNIIFEEFCTDEGYIKNEPKVLQQFVATVFGVQYTGRVWMIGNTISRYNPYMFTWQLRKTMDMKPGDLDLYRFKSAGEEDATIAVEFCSAVESNTNMYFGNDAKNITEGVWETNEQPAVPEEFGKFSVKYRVQIIQQDFNFMLKLIQNAKKELMILCCYAEKEEAKRKVSDQPSGDPWTTTRLLPLTQGDQIMLDLLKKGKLVYVNNLCGTDFNTILKSAAFL